MPLHITVLCQALAVQQLREVAEQHSTTDRHLLQDVKIWCLAAVGVVSSLK